MNTTNRTAIYQNQIINRRTFIKLVRISLDVKQLQFARQASLNWLANFPGDLEVNFLYAYSLFLLGDNDLAITILRKICLTDPEYKEANSLLQKLSGNDAASLNYLAITRYLEGQDIDSNSPTSWFKNLVLAKQSFEKSDFDSAEELILDVLTFNPPTPIPYYLHLLILNELGNDSLLSTLAHIYSTKWPDNLQIKILTSQVMLASGNDTAALENLHWCAAHDTTGQVINRLLGNNHRFKPLWPENLKIYMDAPIPASVAFEMGWNRLGDGTIIGNHVMKDIESKSKPENNEINSTQEDKINQETYPNDEKSTKFEEIGTSEISSNNQSSKESIQELSDIKNEFDRIANRIKKTNLTNADGRFPVYVVLTSKSSLQKKYGENTMLVIDQLLKDLTGNIQQIAKWNSMIFYPDDPSSTSALGMTPVEASDAWKVKLSLSDLDAHLAKRGEMIGALLIIGGDDIIPFHQLPNPTDDSDTNVFSDNPYATIDENYFVPQWPVGRIPDEKGSDAGFLIEQIRFLNNEYGFKLKSKSNLTRSLLSSLIYFISNLFRDLTSNVSVNSNFGYSAEVWAQTSGLVFETLGKSKKLVTCPPTTSQNLSKYQQNDKKCGYFNLHGIQDGNEWYGQKDPTKQSSKLDYPIALSPSQLDKDILSPEIIFSEACYGAWIKDKKAADSIALKFLETGCRCVIGSTCIAYGSVMKPLIAADLLAQEFWRQLLLGIPVGYALMRAKLNLAWEMTNKQGYLDGEDQKTLLSFVLYGDPLANLHNLENMPAPLLRTKIQPHLKTVSDSREELTIEQKEMPEEIVEVVKKAVAKYLPGLENGKVAINPQLASFDPKSSLNQNRSKNIRNSNNQRYVVTLKKSIPQDSVNHISFARMTF
ncbi:MAG: hypothetical protein MUO40_06795, partial [Anaerolineaceae bacterium]|nr:hypothetical protein [Anaerolineaceae bacterium]